MALYKGGTLLAGSGAGFMPESEGETGQVLTKTETGYRWDNVEEPKKYIDLIVVGGGGGGGGYQGGGGGGGAVRECIGYTVNNMSTSVSIGAGGTGGCTTYSIGVTKSYGCDGGNSYFGDIISYGGGGGGGGGSNGETCPCQNIGNGKDGGNGGGGAGGNNSDCTSLGGLGIQGFQGGFGFYGVGGGGGGAGGPGYAGAYCSPHASGVGGQGYYSYIFCTGCFFGTGGTGGMGRYGSCNWGTKGGGCGMSCNVCTGVNATFYGGGGGGGYYKDNSFPTHGGSGCQGIVIVRYKTDGSCGINCATGGIVTTSGDYTYHTFTSNGTFCIVS